MKQFNASNSGMGNMGSGFSNPDYETLGKQDKVVKQKGYYRYQTDKQPVLERTAEQKKIFEEYFCVKNYETTTCVSSYYKTHKLLKGFSFLFWVGLLLAFLIFAREDFDLEYALEELPFIIGVLITVAGIVIKFLSGHYKKMFDNSIKRTVAPQKLMSDEEFESLVREKIDSMNVVELGMERLGIDPEQVKEISPLIFHNKAITDESLRVYNSSDKTLHSSTQYVTLLYFTDEELFVYKLQFDMCCDKQEEWAREFFYQDICDISSYVIRNVVKSEGFQYAYSTVSFEVIASNSQIGFEMDGDDENMASIQAMKQKVREKKASR